MVRKCRGVAEIAVMEVDVRTRAQADLDVPASSSKKRKISSGEFEFSTTSYVRLRSRRRQVVSPENNSVPTARVEDRVVEQPRTVTEDRSSSPSSDDASAFCCSSNGCTELVEESINNNKSVDLEDEKDEPELTYNSSRERRETTPSNQFRSEQSDDMESPAGKSEATSGNRSLLAKMPTESELQEFFIAAEKDIQKRFSEKYNYDIVEDVPLEGRYEWVRLKP